MTILEKLEWALMTLREKLTFGQPEEIAVYSRERRVKGVLLDAVKQVKQLEEDLDHATQIASELLLKVGHRGSNQEDRNHDDQYDKIHDIRKKHGLKEGFRFQP